jgi:hypothetical protein
MYRNIPMSEKMMALYALERISAEILGPTTCELSWYFFMKVSYETLSPINV